MLICEFVAFALNGFSATAVRGAGDRQHGEEDKRDISEGVHCEFLLRTDRRSCRVRFQG